MRENNERVMRGRWRRCVSMVLATAAVAVLAAGCGAETSARSTAAARQPSVPSTTGPAAPTTTVPATTVPAPAITATTAAPAASEPLTDASRLRLDGIGPIRVGMTLEQAEVASAATLRVLREPSPGSDCTYARAVDGPAGLAFMLNGRQIVRVDVQPLAPDMVTPRIATLSGIHVGSTEAEVKATYPGRLTVQGHPYVPAGHYLVYTPADPASRDLSLIFETDGQRVTSFRSGYTDQVSWTEGCS